MIAPIKRIPANNIILAIISKNFSSINISPLNNINISYRMKKAITKRILFYCPPMGGNNKVKCKMDFHHYTLMGLALFCFLDSGKTFEFYQNI